MSRQALKTRAHAIAILLFALIAFETSGQDSTFEQSLNNVLLERSAFYEDYKRVLRDSIDADSQIFLAGAENVIRVDNEILDHYLGKVMESSYDKNQEIVKSKEETQKAEKAVAEYFNLLLIAGIAVAVLFILFITFLITTISSQKKRKNMIEELEDKREFYKKYYGKVENIELEMKNLRDSMAFNKEEYQKNTLALKTEMSAKEKTALDTKNRNEARIQSLESLKQNLQEQILEKDKKVSELDQVILSKKSRLEQKERELTDKAQENQKLENNRKMLEEQLSNTREELNSSKLEKQKLEAQFRSIQPELEKGKEAQSKIKTFVSLFQDFQKFTDQS